MVHLARRIVTTGLTGFAFAAASLPASAAAARADDGTNAEQRALASGVVRSTTREWSASFAVRGRIYSAPRAIFLAPPRRHPARGFGYGSGLGVIIDLGEASDVGRMFGADVSSLIALMIAHEIAHHAQYLNEQKSGVVQTRGQARELEADCAAGWWMGRANARSASLPPAYVVPDLDRQLPRLFQALDTIRNGRIADSESEFSLGHGLSSTRVAAFRKGLASTDVSACGRGVAP